MFYLPHVDSGAGFLTVGLFADFKLSESNYQTLDLNFLNTLYFNIYGLKLLGYILYGILKFLPTILYSSGRVFIFYRNGVLGSAKDGATAVKIDGMRFDSRLEH